MVTGQILRRSKLGDHMFKQQLRFFIFILFLYLIRFYSATHCKLRPALFSGKPLEKVMASIPSLKFSEGNNGNSNPRWRYQGEVVPKSTGSSNISKSTLKSSAAQSFSTSTDPPPSANVEPQQQQQHKRSPRKGKGKGKGKGK